MTKDQRIMWVFGIAAALAAIGALAPLAFTIGAHSRIGSVAIPFGIAAIALAVNAVIYHQGRGVAVALYFVAGLAIVYGILAMLAIPLRLAVVGTCPAAPAHCPAGFEPPLTSGENSGLGTATFCGILAIFIGFYGLVALYRRSRSAGTVIEPGAWPATPPAAPAEAGEAAAPSVEPMPATPAEPTPVAVAEPVPPMTPEPGALAEPETAAIAEPTPVVPPAPKPARRPAARRRAPKAPPSVEEELKELPAPEELKELPPPA
ncbi:MAG: hypothetical protein E6J40_07725 [Chloroflexi bacterium]|nr:MAG: hypothetical protein E6J40_07725 [Chloroflexota bacterium]